MSHPSIAFHTISIITAARNAALTIEDCLNSVRLQRYPDDCTEHLVIDGASTDDTQKILDRTQQIRWISEPDKGLYDAVNKGILAATGEIVGILNADDRYAHDGVLERVNACFFRHKVDACYGDLVYVVQGQTSRTVRWWRAQAHDVRKWLFGWMPPHPTFFVRRSCYERLGLYRLDMGTAADYELMLRFMFKHRIRVAYIPSVLVHMGLGGLSNASLRNRLKAHLMDRKAWQVNGLVPKPWTLLLKPLRKLTQYYV